MSEVWSLKPYHVWLIIIIIIITAHHQYEHLR